MQERERDRRPPNERGYDWTWKKVRLGFLNEHPLCADCEALGRIVAASEVHHVARIADRPDLRLDPGNLVALCQACHAARTGRGE